MDWLSLRLDSLAAGGALPFGGAGSIIAVVMIVALRMLLPRLERRSLRAPVMLLIGHLAFVALTIMSTSTSGLHRLGELAALLLLLLCLGRAGFLLFIDTFLAHRLSRPFPKIFRDILQGLVYMAAVLLTLRGAGAEIDALLTTSALLTAVVGLSLQDTLGNLFAGLSIQAQHPFEVGDWIEYDGSEQNTGRVVEINWRATRVITLDHVEVVIPNGPLARAPIRNFTKPTGVSRRSLYVVAAREQPPHVVRSAIEAAIVEVEGVLAEPAPSVVTSDFVERGVTYWIRFFIDDFEAREQVDSRVRERIWYALRRAGIEIAVPVHDVEVLADNEAERSRKVEQDKQRRERALKGVDFCRALSAEQVGKLAVAAHEQPYAPGEIVVQEGAAGDDFYIVERGEVIVCIDDEEGGVEVEVARLSAGSFFGEMSAMTGAVRSATVRAVTDAWLLVVPKDAFSDVLAEAPEVAERISAVLATRKEQLSSASSKTGAGRVRVEIAEERSGQLLERIKEFFSL